MAIDQSAVARVLGIDAIFQDLRGNNVTLLPMNLALIGQGATSVTYSTTKARVFSATEVGNTYGFGSPLHLAALQIFPANGDGVGTIPVTVFPLVDDGSGVASAGDITPAGVPATTDGSAKVVVNNIDSEEFTVVAADTVATLTAKITTAINAVLEMPVIATDNTTDVGLASKWAGTSANDLVVSVEATSVGVTFGITQPVGGLVNPDVQPALDQFGDVWYTLALNCFEPSDTTILDTIDTFNEGRWGETVRKPFVSFFGNSESSPVTATAVTSVRTLDRTNSQLVEPGGTDLPVTIAARQLARIARVANNNPPQMYTAQRATGLTPGADGDQWTFAQRDAAIKGGSSTIEVKNGVVEISNVVTPYAPTGEPVPAYRFVADIIKLMNVIFGLDLIFSADDWAGAPLIPDDQPTVNPTAKKPRMAVAAVSGLIDGLALEAILSDPEAAKALTVAEIDSQNPKRLNVETTVQLSGNTNIINVNLNFGFFFGTPAVVA